MIFSGFSINIVMVSSSADDTVLSRSGSHLTGVNQNLPIPNRLRRGADSKEML